MLFLSLFRKNLLFQDVCVFMCILAKGTTTCIQRAKNARKGSENEGSMQKKRLHRTIADVFFMYFHSNLFIFLSIPALPKNTEPFLKPINRKRLYSIRQGIIGDLLENTVVVFRQQK